MISIQVYMDGISSIIIHSVFTYVYNLYEVQKATMNQIKKLNKPLIVLEESLFYHALTKYLKV